MAVPQMHRDRAGCASEANATKALLADYASGALGQGLSLVVAGHLTFCPACRRRVARLEGLAGAILAESAAPPPGPGRLRAALARLDAPAVTTEPRIEIPPAACEAALSLPAPVARASGRAGSARWSPWRDGVSEAPLDGFGPDVVSLVRVLPGSCIPAHTHEGEEASLILAGRMRDGGRILERGDLALADGACHHEPRNVGDEPCLCLMALTGPRRFTVPPQPVNLPTG